MSAHAYVTRVRPLLFVVLGFFTACAHGGRDTPDVTTDVPERTSEDRSKVTEDDIRDSPSVPVEQLLAGRVAGVWVTKAPGGGIAVRIRGASTINADTEPLYIVDGVPFRPGPGGALSGIQVHEIESIEVLKDAASTAMYGTRGANGVIVITLKRPQ